MLKKVEINFKPSNPGAPTMPKWRSVVMRDGDVVLKPDGERMLDLEIQSYRDSVDLNIIIQRFVDGDVNAIPNPKNAVYADLTHLPTTRQEVLQTVIDAEARFSELPASVRQQYGDNWQNFYLTFEEAASQPIKEDSEKSSE